MKEGSDERSKVDAKRSPSTERRRSTSTEGHVSDSYTKKTIPKALREQTWVKYMGRNFEGKCQVGWCTNTITVFDFQAGHNVPEVKGGDTTLENLIPICSRCNQSMGSKYTITEWNKLGASSLSWSQRWKAKTRMFCILLLK
jgi:5-methylcytosine-specific restriction endonuclease McrA